MEVLYNVLTYSFDNIGDDTLYEYLYKQIKNDIKTGKLNPGEKLPSKRSFAKHLNISTITVENAYEQLVAEGYIYSIPRSGFYVSDISMYDHEINHHIESKPVILNTDRSENTPNYFIDFVNNSTPTDNFPFETWARLMRKNISENKKNLMIKSPSIGVYQLRCAIVDYLYQFRGIVVEPDQIIVGAGTEYLYSLIIQLLGYDRKYAVEEPGYQKISYIYESNNVECLRIPLDNSGIDVDTLEKSQADVVHITPSHHFPTGIVTPINRRYEILSWASKSESRYIIEDDYDSEFRLKGKPIPALQSIDSAEKVIYINTFSKSLTSTIRISYMVLPKSLMKRYNDGLSFYSCTVSNFEQYTLANFIQEGYFERHISRMRNYYRNIRDSILTNIVKREDNEKVQIMEEDAGLHFLLKVDTKLIDEELINHATEKGIHVSCLSQYYYDQTNAIKNTLIINYSGINAENIEEGVERLFEVF